MHYFEQWGKKTNEGYMNVISFKTSVLNIWTRVEITGPCACVVLCSVY